MTVTYTPRMRGRTKAALLANGAFHLAVVTLAVAQARSTGVLLGIIAFCSFFALLPVAWRTAPACRLTITPERLAIRMLPFAYTARWTDMTALEVRLPLEAPDGIRAHLHNGKKTRWMPLAPFITDRDEDWPERILEQADMHDIAISEQDRAVLLTAFTRRPFGGEWATTPEAADRLLAKRRPR